MTLSTKQPAPPLPQPGDSSCTDTALIAVPSSGRLGVYPAPHLSPRLALWEQLLLQEQLGERTWPYAYHIGAEEHDTRQVALLGQKFCELDSNRGPLSPNRGSWLRCQSEQTACFMHTPCPFQNVFYGFFPRHLLIT